jgi:hypothetical protein
MNIQPDHVHMLVMVPPKISISDYCGIVKGRTAIRVFNQFRELKNKPYWGNHFWTEGYCVDTVGLDSEMIKSTLSIKRPKNKRPKNKAICFRSKKGTIRSLPPLGARHTHPLSGVNSIPPALRVDSLLMNRAILFSNTAMTAIWERTAACFSPRILGLASIAKSLLAEELVLSEAERRALSF